MSPPVLACALAAAGAVIGASPPAPQLSAAPLYEFAPEEGASEDAGADGAAADYAASLAAIDQANIAVNKDPEANLDQLEAAIKDLISYGPQLAEDAAGREALDLSQLNLARALLLIEDEDRAAKALDAVLLTARERKLPIKRFGPTLVKFHDKRRKQLEDQGLASIQVRCRVSCRVVLDEQAATTDSGPLYLGTHRVWVEAADGSAELDLDAARIGVALRPVDPDRVKCGQYRGLRRLHLGECGRHRDRFASIGLGGRRIEQQT